MRGIESSITVARRHWGFVICISRGGWSGGAPVFSFVMRMRIRGWMAHWMMITCFVTASLLTSRSPCTRIETVHWMRSMCLKQQYQWHQLVGLSGISLLCRASLALCYILIWVCILLVILFTFLSRIEMKWWFKHKDGGGSRSLRVPIASNTAND